MQITAGGFISSCPQKAESNKNRNKQHSRIQHQTFQLQYCYWPKKIKKYISGEEDTSPDLGKAMGAYLEDKFPRSVKSGCAMLKCVPSWQSAQQILQRCRSGWAVSLGFSPHSTCGCSRKAKLKVLRRRRGNTKGIQYQAFSWLHCH